MDFVYCRYGGVLENSSIQKIPSGYGRYIGYIGYSEDTSEIKIGYQWTHRTRVWNASEIFTPIFGVFLVAHLPIPEEVLEPSSAYSSRNTRSPMEIPKVWYMSFHRPRFTGTILWVTYRSSRASLCGHSIVYQYAYIMGLED
jgi:hypothetical protein